MKLSVFTSFEPAHLAMELRRWNELTPLFLCIDVYRPELLGWGLTSVMATDELRFFLLTATALSTEFSAGIPAVFAGGNAIPVPFLVLCPDALGTPVSPVHGSFEIIDAAACAQAAGIGRILDSDSQRIADVPYTDAFYRSLTTIMFRRAWHRLRSPPKVIAVDCDGTLWRGLCAEDGADGVQIGSEERALHALLLRQKRAGRLLVLVSKNVVADVHAVFAKRADLGLSLDDVAAQCIGWDSKPQSLTLLAKQLRLSLDSFVFIDDSLAECAEMRAALPQVAVIERPELNVQSMLEAVWPLDILDSGGLGEVRTLMYRKEALRAAERIAAPSFPEYLRSLELRCTLQAATDDDIERILELTQRTNQFNTTALQCSRVDLRTGVAEGRVYAVHAADRFGDYGLCGAVFVLTQGEILRVVGLLLSCRVLGRGVEEMVVDALMAVARSSHCVTLQLLFKPSERNAPVRRFLDRLDGNWVASADGFDHYLFSVAHFKQCPRQTEFDRQVDDGTEASSPPSLRGVAVDWASVARHAATVATQGESSSDLGRPASGSVVDVLTLIADVLGHPVTAGDNLYALGADSVRLLRIVARLRSQLGLELPIGEVMQHRMIEDILVLAEHGRTADDADGADFAGLIQSLYDDAVPP